MLFPKRERSYYQLQAPLTSLIDIVFLLLIYFLLTTNFMVDEGIQVKLPQANATSPQTEKEITIYVDSTGKVFLDNQAVSLNKLFTIVRAKLAEKSGAPVIIKADKSVMLNNAVRVMDVVKAAGGDRLVLATEKD